MECSAKTGHNIDEVFRFAADYVVSQQLARERYQQEIDARAALAHRRKVQRVMTVLLLHARGRGNVWVQLPIEVLQYVILLAFGRVREGHWAQVVVSDGDGEGVLETKRSRRHKCTVA